MLYGKAVKALTAVGLCLLVTLFSGCGNKTAPTDTKENPPVPVALAAVTKGSISAETVITGKVVPDKEVQIIPKISMNMKTAKVPVDVGSKVRKGDLLVQLDTTDLEISLSAALNGLTNAKLTRNQAVLNFNNAKAEYERMKALFAEGAVSQQQLDQAELAYNLAKDSVDAPVVENAQTQIDNIRNQISNATITSPINGEVAVRNVDPGETVGPTQPLLTVVNIDKVFIEGTVAERDIAFVKEGQKVSVKVDAAGGNFDGVVKIVSPVANPQTKGYTIKVEIQNKDHKLKPGMFAEIKLTKQSKKDVVVVPKTALVDRGAGKVVYVVKNGEALERKVETGLESNESVEIIKGLSAGEKLVVEGQQSLFDKAKVSVKKELSGSV